MSNPPGFWRRSLRAQEGQQGEQELEEAQCRVGLVGPGQEKPGAIRGQLLGAAQQEALVPKPLHRGSWQLRGTDWAM
jgi:hypothetical protein